MSAALLGLLAGEAGAANAETGLSLASNAEVTKYATTRLLSARTAIGPRGGSLLLGFEVGLKPGWKTYWRSPGDAGSPPRWHWQEAVNVAAAKVEWPLPQRFSLFGIDTLVYENLVVFPITLRLLHPGQPVKLDLTVDYFVCKNICVPLQGRYLLDIPAGQVTPQATREAALIADFQKRVPVRAQGSKKARGKATALGMKITGVTLEKDGKARFLKVTAAGPGSMEHADLLVEGPDRLGFGTALLKAGAEPGLVSFEVPVYDDGQDAKALLAVAPLTLTLSDGGGKAAEFQFEVN